jgi:DNA repair protein RecO
MTPKRAILARASLFSDAFVTSIVRYGEKDCIARLMLRDQGRIVAFFKNGMVSARGRGAIQAPCLARVAYLDNSDNKMRRLQSFDIDPQSYAQSLSLKSFAYASYMAELIERLLPEEEPAEPVFLLVEAALSALVQRGAEAFILRAFEINLLDFCGYLPDFESVDEDDQSPLFYDPISCRISGERDTHSFSLTSSAISLAKAMVGTHPGQVQSESFDDLLMLGRIFRSRLNLLGIKELKSVKFLKELAANSKREAA